MDPRPCGGPSPRPRRRRMRVEATSPSNVACSSVRAPAISLEVAADADVDERRVGPQLGADASRAGLAVRIGLGQARRRPRSHGVLGLPRTAAMPSSSIRPSVDHLGATRSSGSRARHDCLLVLGAVAEGAAGERTRSGGRSGRPAPRRPPGRCRRACARRPAAIARWTASGSMPSTRQDGDAEAGAAAGQPRLAGCLGDRRRHGVEVVLDEEADRQLPGGGEVHRLEHRADVDRAVAEVADRDVVGAGVLLGPGVSGAERHTAADDGVGAERARLVPLQVHRAAATAAVARGEAQDLRRGLVEDMPESSGVTRSRRGRCRSGATYVSALARNW